LQFLNPLGSEDEQESKVERSVHDNGDEQAARSGVQERQTEARQACSQYTEPTLVDVAEPEQQRRCHYDLGRTEIRERGEIEEEKATKDDLFRNACTETNEGEPTPFRSRDGNQGPDHFQQAPQLPVSDKVKENDGCAKDNGQYGEHATRVVPGDRSRKSHGSWRNWAEQAKRENDQNARQLLDAGDLVKANACTHLSWRESQLQLAILKPAQPGRDENQVCD